MSFNKTDFSILLFTIIPLTLAITQAKSSETSETSETSVERASPIKVTLTAINKNIKLSDSLDLVVLLSARNGTAHVYPLIGYGREYNIRIQQRNKVISNNHDVGTITPGPPITDKSYYKSVSGPYYVGVGLSVKTSALVQKAGTYQLVATYLTPVRKAQSLWLDEPYYEDGIVESAPLTIVVER